MFAGGSWRAGLPSTWPGWQPVRSKSGWGGDAGCRTQAGGVRSGLEGLRMGTQGCPHGCWDAARSREWCLYLECCCSLKHEERLSWAGQNPVKLPWDLTSQILLSTCSGPQSLKLPNRTHCTTVSSVSHSCFVPHMGGTARGAAGGKVLLQVGQASLVLASFGLLHPAGT